MRSFASDNNSGIHPSVMKAIAEANTDHALGYGDDPWTEEAVRKIKEQFSPVCEPFFVFNGTGSNTMALQLLTRSYHSVLCAETAHIYVDECGAPAKMTGCQMRPLVTPDGKLTPARIEEYLHGFGDPHHSQPGVIYLSQSTELGTVYTPDELRAITALAHRYGMYVHMDGARLANAAAALGVRLQELTADCGVDTVSFGGTKNGLLAGECVLVFHPEWKEEASFYRKQSAQLASKMRFLACQFTAYLTDDLWLKNAGHANRMAALLHRELGRWPEIRFTQPVQTNQLFLTLPEPVIERIRESYFLYYWNEKEKEIRIVTSFDTTDEDIQQFLRTVEAAFR